MTTPIENEPGDAPIPNTAPADSARTPDQIIHDFVGLPDKMSSGEREGWLEGQLQSDPARRERCHSVAGDRLMVVRDGASPSAAAERKRLEEFKELTRSRYGRFQVLRAVGAGGQGIVYQARDTQLDREVALKVLRDPSHRARFEREIVIAAELQHPSIIPMYESGEDRGALFYVMRLASPRSLHVAIADFHQRIHQKGARHEYVTGLRELLTRFIQVCDAVAYAHSHDYINRDLKPGNVMLGDFGETLVIDWGLAKRLIESASSSADSELPAVPPQDSQHSRLGDVIGTLGYMSPEQAAGRTLDIGPASDIYALGAILYCILTGRPPLAEDTRNETVAFLAAIQAGTFPKPSALNPNTPRALEAICLKALAKEPQARYSRAAEDDQQPSLAGDVQRWLNDEKVIVYPENRWESLARWIRKRPRRVASIAAGLIVTAASAVAIGIQQSNHAVQLEKDKIAIKKSENVAKNAADLAVYNKNQADKNAEAAIAAAKLAKENAGRADRNADQAKRNEEKEKETAGEFRRELNTSRLLRAQSLISNHEIAEALKVLDEVDEPSRDFVWYAMRRSLFGDMTLVGHRCSLNSVAFSPDGRVLATAGGDDVRMEGEIKLWDTATGKELESFNIHSKPVHSISFSPDGKRILTTSKDGTAKISRTDDGKVVVVY